MTDEEEVSRLTVLEWKWFKIHWSKFESTKIRIIPTTTFCEKIVFKDKVEDSPKWIVELLVPWRACWCLERLIAIHLESGLFYHWPRLVSFPPTINPLPPFSRTHSISKAFSNSRSSISVKAHCLMILRVNSLISFLPISSSSMQSFEAKSTIRSSGSWSKVRPFIDFILLLPAIFLLQHQFCMFKDK